VSNYKKNNKVSVVDLFAGPGGLGEGFSSFCTSEGNNVFHISLSIEKDTYAHQTLLLRSFFRQFPHGNAPEEYYEYIRKNGKKNLDELLDLFPVEGSAARNEARCEELGRDEITMKKIDSLIEETIVGEEKWILIGGPPCQAYSTAGRSRNKGITGYRPEQDKRHFLYREYLRIISNSWPAVFVMENVRGIVSSKVNGEKIFPNILKDLSNPAAVFSNVNGSKTHRYHIYSLKKKPDSIDIFGCPVYKNPYDFTIKCEEYGIPQSRHRVILLGIRDDLDDFRTEPLTASPPVTAEQVLGDLPRLRSGISRGMDSPDDWLNNLLMIMNEQWVSDLAGNHVTEGIAREIYDIIKFLSLPLNGRGNEFLHCKTGPRYRSDWFHDPRLNGVCNSVTKEHIVKDLHRYFFASCFAKAEGRSPALTDFPWELLPEHKNTTETEGEIIFADRFRVQMKDRPATTVMSHIAKDGHYYIHYDPSQCRSFTVREAARLQTFPDNYFFMGPRTQQYSQVGNAVPPLLALKIAEIVYKIIQW